VFTDIVRGNYVRVQDEAAREADRHARRGEWNEAALYCAQAIIRLERLREREPDEFAHVTALAELHYFHSEVLKNLDRIPEAVAAARSSLALYHAVLGIDPVHVADLARDAQSRLGLLELMVQDPLVPARERVAVARARVDADPSADSDLDLARQLARGSLERPEPAATPPTELLEAVLIYRRLRPLGEDDLDLFGRAALRAAEELVNEHEYEEAVACATDAGHAFGALAVRRPERYDRIWYEARELAVRIRDLAEATGT
jgi:hypothetical protein